MKRRDYRAEKLKYHAPEAEQVAFEREQIAKRDARIVRAARLNPDMTVKELAERFGCPFKTIGAVLKRAGVKAATGHWTDEFRKLLSEKMLEKFPEDKRWDWSGGKVG